MVPVREMVACRTTTPDVRLARAIAGYVGMTLLINIPCITPEETCCMAAGAACRTSGCMRPLNGLSGPAMLFGLPPRSIGSSEPDGSCVPGIHGCLGIVDGAWKVSTLI